MLSAASDLGEDAPEFCDSALLIYRFKSFNLDPVKHSKNGLIVSSLTALCKETMQNTDAFRTLESLSS